MFKRRQRWRWIAAGIAVLVLATVAFVMFVWLSTPPPGVTVENFRRLREGMSKEQVANILGNPKKEQQDLESRDSRTTQFWETGTLTLGLSFDNEGVLKNGLALDDQSGRAYYLKYDKGMLERFRTWLGW